MTQAAHLVAPPVTIDVPALGADVQCHELAPNRPPLFIEPRGAALRDRSSFRTWLNAVRPVLDDLIVTHGGIVLRGFPIVDTADFADFIEGFPPFEGGYAGGRAPRATVSGRVMEATRLSSVVRLALHSEMAYRRDYPGRVAFFSRKTAPVGGETLIGDIRNLVDEMDPVLVRKIETLGTRTAINFGPKATDQSASYGHMDQRGWNHAFETDNPEKVEAICAERGLQPIWNDDGSLTVLNVLDPFVCHPRTGKKLYRSILHMKPQAEQGLDMEISKTKKTPTGATLGDGNRLTAEEMAHIDALCDKVTYAWPWRDGDLMMLDNLQVWHGRNPYEGKRDVQVALLA